MNWKNLEQLCLLAGVSSREEPVRQAVYQRAAVYADQLRVDAMGNLIAFKRGVSRGPGLMLTAHLDELGVMVTDITEEGYLKFDPVGEVDCRALIGKRVYLGKEQVPGIFGMKPIHLTTREERKCYPKTDSLYIDIGGKPSKEGACPVARGDVGVFASEYLEFGDGLVKSRALSSRVGCEVLLELLAQPLAVDCTFVFTVQKEVGARGAFGAAFSVAPELVLTIDGATANDLPEVEEGQQGCRLRRGVVLHRADQGTLYDRKTFERLRSLAQSENLPWQLSEQMEGRTDAMAAQRRGTGCRAAALSFPVRYCHTPAGVAAKEDIQALERLTASFVASAGKEFLG
jgi:endoglucanase